MKQSIKSVAAIMFFILGFFTLSFSQDMVAVNKVKPGSSMPASGEATFKEITVERNFSSLFPNATEQKWKISPENSFVSFLNSGRKARASFNEKGSVNYVITNCNMEQLPMDFSKEIKASYADCKMFHAVEIKAYGETAYQAILENATSFITLKYTVDGVEELHLVKK